jgi:DNA invertase Pin-like site-specific DNA recombinase
MSEESRLGREAIETAFALKQFITAGVQVWFYLEDRQRTFDSPTDKLLLSVTAFADEMEREKAQQRTYDAMARKAQACHVTGGRVFRYDNIEVPADAPGPDGRTKRSHVVRRINATEAAVITKIFALCGAGKGFTSIAKTLNADGAPSPRPNPGRPKGWATSSVREILHRSLYRGEVVWNSPKSGISGARSSSARGRNPSGSASRRPIYGSCPRIAASFSAGSLKRSGSHRCARRRRGPSPSSYIAGLHLPAELPASEPAEPLVVREPRGVSRMAGLASAGL